MSNKMRYGIIMVLGVCMNQIFGEIAASFHLPLWLDSTGTALAALLLEPTAGLLVGLADNFILSLTRYDSSSLIYYAVSASVALIVGFCMRKNGKIEWRRCFMTIALVIVTSSVLSTGLTLWRTGGVPTAYWEIFFYEKAASLGIPGALSCFFGVFLVKIPDTIVSAVVVAVFSILLPKQLKTKN